jgi:hypothetical protein
MAVHQRIASGEEVVTGADVIFGSGKTAEGLGVARLKEFVTLRRGRVLSRVSK